jgi:hypothetical protein
MTSTAVEDGGVEGGGVVLAQNVLSRAVQATFFGAPSGAVARGK